MASAIPAEDRPVWSVMAGLIRPLAKALTAEGILPDVQVRIFRDVLGCQVSHGGKGGAGSDLSAECPYCYATGNGGHGGFCPNGSG